MRLWRLTGDVARRAACEFIRACPEGFIVRVTEPTKSRDQEAKYHAMIDDIARQWRHCGRLWEPEDMKRLLIDQARRDMMKDPDLARLWESFGRTEMAPSIDGTGFVMLGVQSRKFGILLAAAFIEWLYAFGADCNPPVVWSEPMVDLPEHRSAA